MTKISERAIALQEATPARFGLVPETMAEAIKLAELMANAKLVPAALQKSPADCLMVIQQAIRWDMDPFAVAQECSVIQGKLMHSGKLVAAVVNARGNLTRRLSYKYEGEGDDRKIIISGQLQGEPEPRVVDVIFKNAKTNTSVWQKQPDQQLMYHGVRVWARRHTPELMLGVWSEEEFDESNYPPTAPNALLHNPGVSSESDRIPESAVVDTAVGSMAADAAPPSNQSETEGEGGAALSIEDMAREAAQRGPKIFQDFYWKRTKAEQSRINAIADEIDAIGKEQRK